MTDTPWTPGPWLLTVRQAMGDAADCTVATIDHDGGPYRGDITRLQSAEHIGGIAAAEMIANARLIAAAPDLYEALDEVAPWFYGEHDYDHPSCRIIRAALARAKGATT